MPGFVLLVRDRKDGSPEKRVGYTVSRKVGGAVVRNRMKRRFREVAREILPSAGIPGADHVFIGRASGIEHPFAELREELVRALRKITQSPPASSFPRKRQSRLPSPPGEAIAREAGPPLPRG